MNVSGQTEIYIIPAGIALPSGLLISVSVPEPFRRFHSNKYNKITVKSSLRFPEQNPKTGTKKKKKNKQPKMSVYSIKDELAYINGKLYGRCLFFFFCNN